MSPLYRREGGSMKTKNRTLILFVIVVAVFVSVLLWNNVDKNSKYEELVFGDNKFKLALPLNWKYQIENSSEIKFIDDRGIQCGGIFLVGYYPNQPINSSLPNHSKEVSIKDIDTSLGKAKLIVLERSYPAASNQKGTWTEVHTIIPIKNKELAYDLWINKTDMNVNEIIKMVESIQQ